MKNLKVNVIMFNVNSMIYDSPRYVEKALSYATKMTEDIFPDIMTDTFAISDDMKQYGVVQNEFIIVDPIRTDLYYGCINNTPEYVASLDSSAKNNEDHIDIRDIKQFGKSMAMIDCVIESIQRNKKLKDFIHDFKVGLKGFYRANLIVLCDNNVQDSFVEIYDPNEARILIDHMIRCAILQLSSRIYENKNMPHVDVSIFMAREIDLRDIGVIDNNKISMDIGSDYQN